GRGLEALRGDVADADDLEPGIGVEGDSVVQATFAHADNDNGVFIHGLMGTGSAGTRRVTYCFPQKPHLWRKHRLWRRGPAPACRCEFSIRLVPFLDLGDDVIHFLISKLGVHREADATRGVGLGVRHAAGDARAFAPRIARLLVYGDRVMGLRINAVLHEVVQQQFPQFRFPGFDNEEVIDVTIARQLGWQVKGCAALQAGGVAGGPLAAQVVPSINVLELCAEDAGVQVVQPAVEAITVNVAGIGPVVAQLANPGVDVGVVGHDGPAVAEGAQVLLDDETGGCSVAEFGDFEALAVSADGLRVVLDQTQIVFVGDFFDGGHVGALAVKMDRENRLGLRRDGRLDPLRVNALGLWAAVHKHGRRSGNPNRLGGGKEGVRVGDDLIAGADTQGHERKPDGVGAVAHADGVFRPVIFRQFAFEALEHGALNILAAQQHFLHPGVNFVSDVLILPDVSVEFDFHGLKANGRMYGNNPPNWGLRPGWVSVENFPELAIGFG